MKLVAATLLFVNLAYAESGMIAYPEDTTRCITPKGLVISITSRENTINFYSCVGPSVKAELRPLMAVRETTGTAPATTEVKIGFVPKTYVQELRKKYKKKFLSTDSAEYKKYEQIFKQALKPEGTTKN